MWSSGPWSGLDKRAECRDDPCGRLAPGLAPGLAWTNGPNVETTLVVVWPLVWPLGGLAAGPGREAAGPGREAAGPGREAAGPGREAAGPGREAAGQDDHKGRLYI
ncbi:MAG TPA: hypothetical protein VKV37_01570 [Ktedonobacteraceae bacterium]|nr:hypothetical protein [Ktedonobacteraceae bacterium]